MKFSMFSILLFSVLLVSCGGGGSSGSNDIQGTPSISSYSQVSSTSSNGITECKEIKPICSISVSPTTNLNMRAPQFTRFSLAASCNTSINKMEWIGLGGKLSNEISFVYQPNKNVSTNLPAEWIELRFVDHPIRFNYANCAGGAQIDFCVHTERNLNYFLDYSLFQCGSPATQDEIDRPNAGFNSFYLTGVFSLGARNVDSAVLFATSASSAHSSLSSSGANGGSSDSTNVTPGNDVACKKAEEVFETQICTSISSQSGSCATYRQSSKCFNAALNSSNGCLADYIESLKQLIRNSDQGALDVCAGTNASTVNGASSKSSLSTSASNSSACKNLQNISPEDFATNQQACECGGGVFSKSSTSWSCKYSKTIRGCSQGSDGKWLCGIGDV